MFSVILLLTVAPIICAAWTTAGLNDDGAPDTLESHKRLITKPAEPVTVVTAGVAVVATGTVTVSEVDAPRCWR